MSNPLRDNIKESVEIHRPIRDTGSSLYTMGSSPERRLTDDDDETGEEEENGEETESEEAEETESSALIREDGEGRIMEEKEPSLKRDKVLAASNGRNAGGHKWPKLGLDCTEGRMVCLSRQILYKLTPLLESDRLYSGMSSYI